MLSLKGSFRRKRASHSAESDPARSRGLVSSIRAAVRRKSDDKERPHSPMRMASRRVLRAADDKELARTVMRVTSPERSAIDGMQLARIAYGVVHCGAGALDAAVRALGYRMDSANAQSILNALDVADYLMCNVAAPRATITNVRAAIEHDLLPRVKRIAMGEPSSPGDRPPPPAARRAALDRLQEWEWASTNYAGGALVQDPAFAEAYREASLHCVTRAVSCDA